MSVGDSGSTAVKPLTKRRKDTSEPYFRRAEVELQLARACSLSSEELFAAFPARNRDEDGYLFDETLVYLLREARGKDDRSELNALYEELNLRIWRILKGFRHIFAEPADFEDFGQSVEAAVLTKVLDLDSDAADYAQVNFGDFVAVMASTARRGVLASAKKERTLFLQDRHDDGNGFNVTDGIDSGEVPADDLLILKQTIAKLPPRTKLVVALLADGWKIESKDPDEPTITKHLGVTSRTIRNWISEARKLTAGLEGDCTK